MRIGSGINIAAKRKPVWELHMRRSHDYYSIRTGYNTLYTIAEVQEFPRRTRAHLQYIVEAHLPRSNLSLAQF